MVRVDNLMNNQDFITRISELQTISNELDDRLQQLDKSYQVKEDEIIHQIDLSKKSLQEHRDEKKNESIKDRKDLLDYWERYKEHLETYEAKLWVGAQEKAGFHKIIFAPAEPNFNVLNQLWNVINKNSFFSKISGSWRDAVCKYCDIIGQGKSYIRKSIADTNSFYDSSLKKIDSDYHEALQNLKEEQSKQIETVKISFTEKRNKVIEHYGLLLASKMDFNHALKSYRSSLGAEADSWVKYRPSTNFPSEIMIGDVLQEFQFSDVCRLSNPDILWDEYESIKFPFVMNFFAPLNLYIKYSEENHDLVFSGINAILLRIISKMPINCFHITYIDPVARGSNLKRLKVLSELNGCHICGKPAANRTDIALRLKMLENLVDELSLTLATVGTVYDYNKTYNDKMDYHILVLNDFPNGLEGPALDSLEVIINNAHKCGISIIITQKDDEKIEHGISDLIEKINNTFQCIDATKQEVMIDYDGKNHPFVFSDENIVSGKYLEEILDEYSKGSVRDNSFKRLLQPNRPIKYLDAKKGLSVPFSIDNRNQMCNIEIGGDLTAHCMISGSTGSGKSNTLHAIIAGILLNYHPDDVELWLIDYKKVEFAEYLINTPPHVRIIGLDRTEEFTFSLLDKVKEEFERRMELFTSVHVTTIEAYNSLEGIKPLPRIILVIDEFHNLTQTIQGNQYYTTLFENALSEYRVLGLSCILSDQAIREGLRGMTDKGRMQVHNRLAMRNEMHEVKETLAIDNSYYTERLLEKIRTLGQGEIIFKKEYRNRFGDTQIRIDKYLGLLVTSQDRKDLLAYLRNYVTDYIQKDLIVVKGQYRVEYSEKEISKFEESHSNNKCGLYVGSPSSLDSCFMIPLENKTDENVIIIGSDANMRFSILFYAIKSYLRNSGNEVIIMAHKDDEIYLEFKEHLKFQGNFRVIDDLSEICVVIQELKELINTKKESNILVVVLGIYSLFESMEKLEPKKQPKSTNTYTVSESNENGTDALVAMIQSIEKGISKYSSKEVAPVTQSAEKSKDQKDQNMTYNARGDFIQILSNGSRLGIHVMLNLESVKSLKRFRGTGFTLEDFKHKIALQMTKDDAYTYIDNARAVTDLDEISAIYNDGSNSYKLFRPYLLPKVMK